MSERSCSRQGEGGTKPCTVTEVEEWRFGDVLVGESGIKDDAEVSDRARGSTVWLSAWVKSLGKIGGGIWGPDLLTMSLSRLLFISEGICEGGENGRRDGFCGYIKQGIIIVALKLDSMAVCDVTEGQHVQKVQQGTEQCALGDTTPTVYHLQLYMKISWNMSGRRDLKQEYRALVIGGGDWWGKRG